MNYDMKLCFTLVCYAPDAEFIFWGLEPGFKRFHSEGSQKFDPLPADFFMIALKITKKTGEFIT